MFYCIISLDIDELETLQMPEIPTDASLDSTNSIYLGKIVTKPDKLAIIVGGNSPLSANQAF